MGELATPAEELLQKQQALSVELSKLEYVGLNKTQLLQRLTQGNVVWVPPDGYKLPRPRDWYTVGEHLGFRKWPNQSNEIDAEITALPDPVK